MNIKIGPPVTGGNFLPRPALIKKIVRALNRGNVAFLGPRRTGKTSCLECLKANPPDGYIAVLLNLEKHDTPLAWFTEMMAEARKALEKPENKLPWAAKKGAAFLKRIEEIKVMGHGFKLSTAEEKIQAWRKMADDFLVLLKESDAPLLFLLDEFPAFLNLVAKKNSKEEVEALLNWFRAARHELNDHSPRFLVTGSIGLKGVVRRLGLLPAINDFDVLDIPPLTNAEALELLERLANDNKIPLDVSGQKKILELIGANWPILIQLFISEIQEEDFSKAPTQTDLTRLYRDRMVAGNRNEYCAGMFSRLIKTFSASEYRLASEILRTLARSAKGFSRQQFETIHAKLVPDETQRFSVADELEFVLDALKHDGYLLQDPEGEQRTRFGSNILRDYWLRKTA